MKQHVNIALLGFGTVGSGTMQLLKEQREDIEARVGAHVHVKWVVSRYRKKSPYILRGTQQTSDWKRVVNDPMVDCVVEVVGGTNPALQMVMSALKAGKHVVTANKTILAEHWNEIFDLAEERRRIVYFEAAVGGGIPVIQALDDGMAGNRVHKISGILNGTTNFILTKMQESGTTFQKALKEAQKAGFAEANPSFDIEGIDAAQKISILASLACRQWIPSKHVYSEGISKLQTTDIRIIRDRLHRSIKLLAIAEETEKGWILRVHPTIVPSNHPFANVRNEYNAVSLHGNAVDDVMLYGKGAGRFPTSSAVISDIIYLCRHIAHGTANKLPYPHRNNSGPVKIADMDEAICRYYLRISTKDRPGVLSRISGILGENDVSIASVHQDLVEDGVRGRGVPVVLVTHACREVDMQQSVASIDKLATTRAKTVLLRME